MRVCEHCASPAEVFFYFFIQRRPPPPPPKRENSNRLRDFLGVLSLHAGGWAKTWRAQRSEKVPARLIIPPHSVDGYIFSFIFILCIHNNSLVESTSRNVIDKIVAGVARLRCLIFLLKITPITRIPILLEVWVVLISFTFDRNSIVVLQVLWLIFIELFQVMNVKSQIALWK